MLSPEELASKFSPRTKAIVINTPNNPLGKVSRSPTNGGQFYIFLYCCPIYSYMSEFHENCQENQIKRMKFNYFKKKSVLTSHMSLLSLFINLMHHC